MASPNKIFTSLVVFMKTHAIPNDEFPNERTQGAYSMFKAYVRNVWIYERMSVDEYDFKVGGYGKMRKLVLKIYDAGISQLIYGDEVKDSLTELVCAILESENEQCSF